MKGINNMNNSENRNRSSTKSVDSMNYYSISFIVLSFLALVLYIFVILLYPLGKETIYLRKSCDSINNNVNNDIKEGYQRLF